MVFADTSFFVAMGNQRDVLHSRARALSGDSSITFATTDYVLIEVGNYFRRPRERPLFLIILQLATASERVHVIEASRDLQERGIELFAQRPDKAWSLTDCISFVVMRERFLTEALTSDRHFEQAGFRALLLGD